MSLHEKTAWIICYDIGDDRRLRAVHRRMKRVGVPLQYSVFQVIASAAELHALLLELEDLINLAVDDVRAYRCPLDTERHQLGPGMTPDGILLHDAPKRPAKRAGRRTTTA